MRRKVLLIFIIMLIFVVTLIYVGINETYSKYTVNKLNNNSLSVAKWRFKLNGTNQILDIDLKSTLKNNKYSNTEVIPGTKGEINLEFDSTGSEVGVKYNISLSKSLSVMPPNLDIYSDEACNHKIDNLTFSVNALPTNKINKKIYWKWKYTEDEENSWSGKLIHLVFLAEAMQK